MNSKSFKDWFWAPLLLVMAWVYVTKGTHYAQPMMFAVIQMGLLILSGRAVRLKQSTAISYGLSSLAVAAMILSIVSLIGLINKVGTAEATLLVTIVTTVALLVTPYVGVKFTMKRGR